MAGSKFGKQHETNVAYGDAESVHQRLPAKPVSFFDMFAGVGGFRLALERLGWKCVGWCEVDKYAGRTYAANFDTEGEFFRSDATTLDTSSIPDFDVLVAGFPCQSFSTAGRRLGFEDARGTLFLEIARLLRDRRPRAFLLENVRGLVFHDEGRTLNTILDLLAATVNGQAWSSSNRDCLGYHVWWRVLNSRDFGVPQDRKRIFVVGFRDAPAKPFEFPIGGALQDVLEAAVPEKYYLSDKLVRSLVRHMESHGPKRPDTSPERSVKSVGERGNTVLVETANRGANMRNARVKRTDVARTLDRAASQAVAVVSPSANMATTNPLSDRQRALVGNGPLRRFTPRECARLQGFPDTFILPCSDTQSYRQMGNTVTVFVVEAVGRKMVAVLFGGLEKKLALAATLLCNYT